MWLTLGLASLLADPDLIIRSSTDCPPAAAVAREAESLLPAGTRVRADGAASTPVRAGPGASEAVDAAEGADHVEIFSRAGKRWVRVRTSAGQVTEPREIPAALTCGEAARAAALWLAALQFQGGAELPVTPAEAPPVAPRPAPAAQPRVTSPPPPSSVLTASSPAGAAPSPRPAAPPPGAPWRLAIGGGFSAGRSVNQYPMVAGLEVAFGDPTGLGLRVHGARSSRYSLQLGTGRATWTRSSLGAGLTYTGRRGAWGAEAHADVIGALLDISGDGFAVNEDDRQYAAGATLGGRVIRALGPADLWIDLSFTAWPGRNQVFLGLGISFFVWR